MGYPAGFLAQLGRLYAGKALGRGRAESAYNWVKRGSFDVFFDAVKRFTMPRNCVQRAIYRERSGFREAGFGSKFDLLLAGGREFLLTLVPEPFAGFHFFAQIVD